MTPKVYFLRDEINPGTWYVAVDDWIVGQGEREVCKKLYDELKGDSKKIEWIKKTASAVASD